MYFLTSFIINIILVQFVLFVPDRRAVSVFTHFPVTFIFSILRCIVKIRLKTLFKAANTTLSTSSTPPPPPPLHPLMSASQLPSLAGRVALVTGGASGLGAATVSRFVNQGAKVVFCDLKHRADRGQALEAELGSDFATFFEGDVTSVEDVTKVYPLFKQVYVGRKKNIQEAVSCNKAR